MAKGKKIQLLQARSGLGDVGDVVTVGAERAERWCREGIAVLPSSSEGKTSSAAARKKAEQAVGAAEKAQQAAKDEVDKAKAALEKVKAGGGDTNAVREAQTLVTSAEEKFDAATVAVENTEAELQKL